MDKKKIGVIVALEDLIGSRGTYLTQFDLKLCEIKCWHPENYTEENSVLLKKWLGEDLFEVSGLWCGWSGPVKWDLYEGPHLLGLVPTAYRAERIQELRSGIDFAGALGLDRVTTHIGFIPENPLTTEYHEIVSAAKNLAEYASGMEITFNLETGQETPVTLVRFIRDLGIPDVGVNLDPANLLLYGRGNPVDAVGIYGDLIHGVHIKDGFYPGTGEALGREVNPGEGLVDFPALFDKLDKSGYNGDYIIERELKSGNAVQEVRNTISFLKSISVNRPGKQGEEKSE